MSSVGAGISAKLHHNFSTVPPAMVYWERLSRERGAIQVVTASCLKTLFEILLQG